MKPDLNIVDATFCMERMGPRGGDIFPMGLIMAGADSGCTDYAGMQIMGYSIDEVRHLDLFLKKEGTAADKIRILGESIESVKRPFKKVMLENILADDIEIKKSDECSSCYNALILSLSVVKEKKNKLKIHIGSKPVINNISNEDFIFGNCAIKASGGKGIPVKGCPPYPFELNRLLETKGGINH